MKWIDENAIPGGRMGYMQLLEEKGIYYKSSSEFMRSPYSFADKKGVWIVFEKQYADAVALLQNPEHVVVHPITEEEVRNIEAFAKSRFDQSVSKYLNAVAFVVLTSVLVGFCYFVYVAIHQE